MNWRVKQALLLSVWLMPPVASAQVAPTGGQYAARGSDTGFEGSVDSQGGYGATVPLALPAARGGLPVPLKISYTGHGLGAAGLGWDVASSYIFISASVRHNKPLIGNDGLSSRQHLTLVLNGQTMNLVDKPTSGGQVFVPQVDGPQLEVHQSGDGSMVMYDGNGLTYTFTAQGASAGSRLSGGQLLLLRTVTGRGNSVSLQYSITSPTLAGGTTSALAINLTSISYNTSPGSTSCNKNQIVLNYDNPDYGVPAILPLSLQPFGEVVLVRTNVLTRVDVNSTAGCPASYKHLRQYFLKYPSPDPDTQQPRLAEVQVFGRDNTVKPISLGKYSYATASVPASGSSRKLHYSTATAIPLPTDVVTPSNIAYSGDQRSADENTWQTMLDFTGDGLPDFLYHSVGNNFQDASMAPQAQFGYTAPRALSSPIFGGQPFESQAPTSNSRYFTDHDYVWRQALDFNGDGRVDIVDAHEVKGSWVVYLNTPNGSADVTWNRIELSVSGLMSELKSRNYVIDNDSGYMPLASRVTGRLQVYTVCAKYDGGPTDDSRSWEEIDPSFCLNRDFGVQPHVGPEKTFTEWELRDLNGDGFPDVIFDAGPITHSSFAFEVAGGTPAHLNPGFVSVGSNPQDYYPSTGAIAAMFNGSGTHLLDKGAIEWSPASAFGTGPSVCGVAMWVEDQAVQNTISTLDSVTEQACGFADVNGDGIPDRIEGTTAYIRVGDFIFDFGAATVTLPGAASIQRSNHRAICGENLDDDPNNPFPGTGTYHTFSFGEIPSDPRVDTNREAGLVDVNGDGIADYVSLTKNAQSVRFGTGAGYAPPIPFDAGFVLSHSFEDCFGNFSITDEGAFDLDGDGKVDLLDRSNEAGPTMKLHQLMAGSVPGTPEAGRLVQVDNTHGAKTKITYANAKTEDNQTYHGVPFPEIVVTAVETVDDSKSPATTLVEKNQHAYGTPELVHDDVLDRFGFGGYRRTVEMHKTNGSEGIATITDTYGLVPLDPHVALGPDDRLARQLSVGRPSDVTIFSGNLGDSPNALLAASITTDPRIIGSTHYTWAARLFQEPNSPFAPDPLCIELVDPYDWNTSNGEQAYCPCTSHGFAFLAAESSWRGEPGAQPASSTANVNTFTQTTEVDDLGRVQTVLNLNDTFDPTDDVRVHVEYPSAVRPGALNAPLSREVTSLAGDVTYAKESWVRNTDGLASEYTDFRVAADGTVTDSSPAFDATYDALDNLKTATKTREDGATHTVTFTYDPASDPFSMAPASMTTTGSGGPAPVQSLTVAFARDPLSLQLTSTTDSNGTSIGAGYDGFDRQIVSTVQPMGGALGAMAAISYQGVSIGETGGLRVVQAHFTDPVDLSTAADAVKPNSTSTIGRRSTTYLDQLGRAQDTVVELGASYSNQNLIAGARTYDTLGRVTFEADPYPASQNGGSAFGTTNYYRTDGTPLCSIRGNGPQPLTLFTDEADEIYPTCYQRSFLNHVDVAFAQDAASLGATAQAGIQTAAYVSAIGRPSGNVTWSGATRLEFATFTSDPLGHLTSMTRYHDPATATNPLTSSWETDSQGHVVTVNEPESPSQRTEYDHWGEPTGHFSFDLPTRISRRVTSQYDALGRLVHKEEGQSFGSSTFRTDPDSVNDYHYDQPVNLSAPVTVNATNVLGRLAQAVSPTGSVSLSYDSLGRVNARVFNDDQNGGPYVEKQLYHGDGSEQLLDLLLPDPDPAKSYQDEQVTYGYDSAGRGSSVHFSDGVISEDLFEASTTGAIDALGRIRQAQFGNTSYAATYADVGRRLISDLSFSSNTTSGTHSREIAFPPTQVDNRRAFDPVGRERARTEITDGNQAAARLLSNAYDPIGRLQSTLRVQGGDVQTRTFNYDALGNIVSLQNPDQLEPSNAFLSFTGVDRDRVSSIDYGFSGARSVTYDGVGNIIQEPGINGTTRTLSYFAAGQVKQISDGQSTADFRYDAFGAVQKLTVTSTSSQNSRHDRHYGSIISFRDVDATGTQVLTRSIPGPGGFIATRLGATGHWVFGFGEGRGSRFFTDENGNFVQDVAYEPYGAATSTGTEATPHNLLYSTAQWNGGDLLETFGLVNLGVRVYDPVIGRFLQRDPLLTPRTAATTNPYAFASNDPFNGSDPSGLQDEGLEPVTTDIQIAQVLGGEAFEYDESHGTFGPIRGSTQFIPSSIFADPARLHAFVAGYNYAIDRYIAQHPHWYENLGTRAEGLGKAALGGLAATVGGTACGATDGIGCVVGAGALFAWGIDYGWAGSKQFTSGRAVRSFLCQNLDADVCAFIDGVATEGIGYLSSRNSSDRGAIEGNSSTQACSGGKCSCFTAGTPVATDSGLVPIETVQPGDRVHSLDTAQCTEPVSPESCRMLEVEMENPYGFKETLTAKFLRSEEWVKDRGVHVGEEAPLQIEELLIDGPARIKSISACTIQPGTGCLVTGTVAHLNSAVLRLHFAESGEVLEPTTLHQLWSFDRNDWVHAGDLEVGERLLTEGEAVTISSIEHLEGVHEVFNFEVAGAHTYLVSGLRIKSHNVPVCVGSLAGVTDAHAGAEGEQGFAGAFDPWNQEIDLVPTWNNNEPPPGYAQRNGGHGVAAGKIGGESEVTQAFTVFRQGDKALRIEWASGINSRNFRNRLLPPHFRQSVVNAVTVTTGKQVIDTDLEDTLPQ